MKLYEIHDEIGQLFEQLEAAETPEQMALISNQLQSLTISWDDKLASCCGWLKNLEAEAEMFNAEVEKLMAKYNAAEAKAERFKEYLAKFAPQTKWKFGPHSIGWRESTRVEVDDENLLPLAFKREVWKLEPDKKEIKAALETGAEVPGAKLVKEKHIQVK